MPIPYPEGPGLTEEEHPATARAELAALPGSFGRLLAVEPEEHALRRLLSTLVDLVPEADSAALLATQGGRLALAATIGLEEGAADEVGDGFARRVAEHGDVGAIEVTLGPDAPFPAGTRCGAAVRMAAPEGPAALLLGSRSAAAFDPRALALLAVAADRAAVTLERALLRRERDAAAEEARRTREEASSRRNAVDFILGIVGHDLRNPLGAIHMSAALLQKRGALEGWQARAVERMRSSAGRMNRIIADLLSYTRTRLGSGVPVLRRPGRLDEIARRAVDELQAANPDRALVVEARGELSGEWDPDRLEQVVSNLVSNAIDHGDPEAPVRVELSADGEEACTLRVANRGPPMPPEVLSHVFEPFSRPPEDKSRKGSGLGLGLYISREIVRAHGGEISVSSNDETVMTVRLPRRGPADGPGPADPRPGG
ncbi:sensor histidine kinase [Anaeromyxobacter oryzisoli]|uniref:sensor histidine kinase n=1 Tax=Anaeromyxobacter oryzisoli TaxID=2925408 RepID=UPI001F579C0A|nr:HAMP domain-containing sensor histidine kinase [Anaeromyxobacter sp. SG63]